MIGTALVDMYANCGELEKAQEVFDMLPAQNVAAWTALIAGYAQFGKVKTISVEPDIAIFVVLLTACSHVGLVEEGQMCFKTMNTHYGIIPSLEHRLCMLPRAEKIFRKLPLRDVASWTVLITGYAKEGLSNEALKCYADMKDEGLLPNAVTYLHILKAYGYLRPADEGEKIHADIERQGLFENDVMLGTALVDMYAKCGSFKKAQKVFDKLPLRNVVTWNAIISGFAQHGLGEEALKWLGEMQGEGLSPDEVTLLSILKACSSIGAIEKGATVHAEVCKHGSLIKDIMTGTALVDMYANCGELEKAQEVFDMLPARNVAAWTALIAAYAQ